MTDDKTESELIQKQNALLAKQNEDLIGSVAELTKKVNSLITENQSIKEASKCEELVKKINGLPIKVDIPDSLTSEELEKFYSLLNTAKVKKDNSNENQGTIPTGGTDSKEMIFTPNGMVEKDKARGLAIKKNGIKKPEVEGDI